MTRICSLLTFGLVTLLFVEGLHAQEKKSDPVPLDHSFGFQPLEIVKLADRAHSIQTGDFNNDGRTDIAIVDNSKNQITLLIQREKKIAPALDETPRVNDLLDAWRYELRHLPMDREIKALCSGDFNGDGRLDLATYGDPDRLVIRYQPESGAWKETREFRIQEIQSKPFSIVAGDVNNDGQTDLVALGKTNTYVILQKQDKTMADPIVLRNTSSSLGLGMIADLNGDGRNDLLALASDDQKQPFCIRLQTPDSKLGPELRFRLEEPRGVTLHNMDGKPGSEILAIDSRTNRVRMFSLDQPTGETADHTGRIIAYGYGGSDTGDRDLAIADVDGDGKPDVVVSDPDLAQVVVFLQKNQELDLGTAYPSFLGVSQLRLSDVDKDGKAEVIALSSRENTIGISTFNAGRLTFPTILEVSGEVRVFETLDLNGDGLDEIVAITKESGGRSRGASKYQVKGLTRDKDGHWKPYKAGEKGELEIELPSEPHRLVKVDANQDGRMDLLVTTDSGKTPHLLLQTDKGALVSVTETGGLQLGDAKASAVFSGTLDKPVFLVAQGKFVRSMSLDANRKWSVLDQFNAPAPSSRIEGSATLDLDGEPGNEVVLIDIGTNKLLVFRKSETGYTQWRELDLGPFQFRGVHVADLNSDGKPDLLLTGTNRFAVLYAGLPEFKLNEIASFESKLKNVLLMDLIAGDLNNDGRPDVVVIDGRTHLIELLTVGKENELLHALQFKVYEDKTFSGSSQSGLQPREAAIADVTGDGLPDLILLSHDRLLVYPQDSGEPAPKP